MCNRSSSCETQNTDKNGVNKQNANTPNNFSLFIGKI